MSDILCSMYTKHKLIPNFSVDSDDRSKYDLDLLCHTCKANMLEFMYDVDTRVLTSTTIYSNYFAKQMNF